MKISDRGGVVVTAHKLSPAAPESHGVAPLFVWYLPNPPQYTTQHGVLVEGEALGKNAVPDVPNKGEPDA